MAIRYQTTVVKLGDEDISACVSNVRTYFTVDHLHMAEVAFHIDRIDTDDKGVVTIRLEKSPWLT